MLVYFHKSFLMEGKTHFKERKHFWNKAELVEHTIYLTTGVWGICDESEVEAEVERLTKENLKTSGWGYHFKGWHRIVPYLEACDIAKKLKWDKDYHIPTNEVRTEPVNEWPMEKILKELNGKQFAKFCRDNNIPAEGVCKCHGN